MPIDMRGYLPIDRHWCGNNLLIQTPLDRCQNQ